MHSPINHRCLIAVSLLLVAVGCGRSAPPAVLPATRPAEPTIALHWVGTKDISKDTNAAGLLEIARLSSTVKLREQTVEKLSRAPWTLQHRPADTNASALLRPLVRDALTHECLFQLMSTNNHATAWVLASRLDPQPSRLWETNLADTLESLTGKRPASMDGGRSGWLLTSASASPSAPGETSTGTRLSFVCFTRSGDWTVFGAAQDQGLFEATFKGMLNGETAAPSTSNSWLEASVNLPQLALVIPFSTNLFTGYPSVHLTVQGDGGNVRTVARFQFPGPLDLKLEPWNVPTNLITQPLASFTAARGLDGLLSESPLWKSLDLGPAPDRLFCWALGGRNMFTYFAAHFPDPNEFLTRMTHWLLPNGQAWFDKERMAGFKRSKGNHGIEWQGLPYLYPFLKTVSTNGFDYVIGGAFPYAPPPAPLSTKFYEDALSSTDLVLYDWEQTGPRIGHWLYIGQFVRYTTGHAQLPFESAGLLWLRALEKKLGDSLTRISLNQPSQLIFTRSSSLGLTAIELQLLVDWLESTDFPRGLHTLNTPLPTRE